MGFFNYVWYMILYGLLIFVIIMVLQYLAKKYYEHLKAKYGESSIFLKKFYEADSFAIFAVVVVLYAFWAWLKGEY